MPIFLWRKKVFHPNTGTYLKDNNIIPGTDFTFISKLEENWLMVVLNSDIKTWF